MILTDDRNEQELKTHHNLIGGLDSYLSGWGRADDVNSYAYWACADEHVKAVEKWVSSREEFSGVCVFKSVENVSIDVYRNTYVTSSEDDLVHVYVVDENHRAVKEEHEWIALTNQPQGH